MGWRLERCCHAHPGGLERRAGDPALDSALQRRQRHLGPEYPPPHPPQQRGRLLGAGGARRQPAAVVARRRAHRDGWHRTRHQPTRQAVRHRYQRTRLRGAVCPRRTRVLRGPGPAALGHQQQHDAGPHRQHRLRSGRSRRRAHQPDAILVVLSREARVLPRERGHLRFRSHPGRGGACAGRCYACSSHGALDWRRTK